MRAFFHKHVIAQIGLLLGLFLVSLIGLKIGRSLLDERQAYLHELVDNEENKIALSTTLQKRLLRLNVKVSELPAANTVAEMTRLLGVLAELRTEIAELLTVLERGGKKRVSYPVNFGNEELIERDLIYVNHRPQQINLEIIELRAKLAELESVFQEYKGLISKKIDAIAAGNQLLLAEIVHRLNNYYKGVEPFFQRIMENSNRLYFEGEQEKQRIENIYAEFRHTYSQVESTSTAVVVTLTLLMGSIILRSSYRILLERKLFQEKLQESNKDLEKTVQQRTAELRNEIRERRTAQTTVAEQAEFLMHIIESLAYPFSVIDADSHEVVLANLAAKNRLGRESQHCFSMRPGSGVSSGSDERPCPLQLIRESGEPVAVEHCIIDANGEQKFYEVHGYPVFDPQGKLIQMIEYSLDITDKKNAEHALIAINDMLEQKVRERTRELEEQVAQRKKAQQKLARSERQHRQIIESITDIITLLDEDGIIDYASPSAGRILGFPSEYYLGRDIRDLVLQEDLQQIDIRTLCERHGGREPFVYRLTDQYGNLHVLESYIQEFRREDDSKGFLLCSRDVTERKKVEAERRKLQMVVEQSPSSIVITDTQGTIEYVNPAFEKVTGYSAVEAIGRNPRILQSGETSEATFAKLWTTILAGDVWQGEFVNKKKSGDLYTESVLVLPIKDVQGKITHFVALKENITELKQAQKQAEQANRAKTDFLSQMSHELRTPLNAINGFSQLMLKSRKHPLSEKQQGMVEQIYAAGNHLLHLINEVLDLAKIESGEFTMSIEHIDPRLILTDCLTLIGPLAKEKEIKVMDRSSGGLPMIKADLTRVKQVLLNLLSNGVKYNRSGGYVDISVDTDLPGLLRFVVKDNGIGIRKERQKDIFVPFTRLAENSAEIEGTGIGMTIARQLVTQMGGDIGFDSEEGVGSTFWFTVPVAVGAAMPIIVPVVTDNSVQPIRDPSGGECKLVLYVEDNPVNAFFAESLFAEQENYRLLIAGTGEDALSIASREQPELILMDLNLPGIDGFEACQRLKADPITREIPIVAVSADAMERTLRRVNREGFAGFVAKPIDITQLQEVMTEIIGDNR